MFSTLFEEFSELCEIAIFQVDKRLLQYLDEPFRISILSRR